MDEKTLELLKEIKKKFEARDDCKVDYNNPGPLENKFIPLIKALKLLKWDDLEFDDKYQFKNVLLNGLIYTLAYKYAYDSFNEMYYTVSFYREGREQIEMYEGEK